MRLKIRLFILLLATCHLSLATVFGQQAPIFRTHFSAPVGTTIIPPCTTQASTAANPCIANQSQTAGSVSFNWNLISPSSIGFFFIEGSNDLKTWFILAQNAQGASGFFSNVLGVGDGATVTFSGNLSVPVVPGSVTVSDGFASANDDSLGNIPCGCFVAPGAINYATGAISFTYNGASIPPVGANIVVTYRVSGLSGGTSGGIIFYNGAYAHIRIYIVVPSGGASTLIGDYSALPQPLPLNSTTDFIFASNQVGNVVTAGTFPGTNVIVVQGVQCYNPNASVAFLQLLKSSSGSPALGSGPFFEIPIPAHSNFSYIGPPVQIWNMVPNPGMLGSFWLGASTASLGSTPVGTPLECNVQLNTTGPFYPLTPVGP